MYLGFRNWKAYEDAELTTGAIAVNTLVTISAVAAILSVSIVALFFLVGPTRIWSMFGPPDLGPVTFETLERRITPNDALACPPTICKARSDLVSPLFAVDVTGLRAAMLRVIASEVRTTRVDANDADLTERYVQRSALLEFPDTIVLRYLEEPGNRSMVAMYSRSQLGRSDFGVNKARIERWIAKLKRRVAVVE